MANKEGHRRFGAIRKLPSGRFQARYPGPDGKMRTGPETYATRVEAERFLTLTEAQLMRREWLDPDVGRIALGAYADQWITDRHLRPRTVGLYRQLLRTHIVPVLGDVLIRDLTTPMIRSWRSKLLGSGVSQTVAAKCYRLLRAVLNTAVKEDEMIRVNPCRIKGADREDAPERPTLTLAQVFDLAGRVPLRYRALILLATFGCLRWGEVTALRRADLDLDSATVRVRHSFSDHPGKGLVLGPPKSRAGLRTVSFPAAIVADLRQHLATYVPDDPTALLFTGPSARRPPLRRNNFRKLVGWEEAVTAIGAPGLHFHDLRHTGNTEAARTGASTKDLMVRMGHDSPSAALKYQHATNQADRAIADALSDAVAALQERRKKHATAATGEPGERQGRDDGDDGAAGALVRVG